MFELPPRAAIKLRTAENLHAAGQRKCQPLKPRCHGEVDNPFANHQRGGDSDAEEQIPLPAGLALFATAVRGGFGKPGLVARSGDSLNDRWNILRCVRRPTHGGAPALKHHRCAADAGHALNGVGHMPRAVLAGHAVDLQVRHDETL